MDIKWEEFPASVHLIGLITSADFNRLLIDLKLAVIDFRISADSQPYYIDIMFDCMSHSVFNIAFGEEVANGLPNHSS